MATIVAEEKVQIRFTVTDDDGTTFTDALYMTTAERASATPEQLDAAQRARFDAWKAAVAAPAPVVEIDMAAQARELLSQREAIDAQLDLVPADVLVAAKADLGLSPVLIEPIEPAPILLKG